MSEPSPSPAPETQEYRRRRRTHQRQKHRRHRDLSPEADNRRRHIQIVLLIIPIVLTVAGLAMWFAGARRQNEDLHIQPMIQSGCIMMALGLLGLFIWLVWTWCDKIKQFIFDKMHPPIDTNLNFERHHRHSGRRKRRTYSPHHSQFHSETSNPSPPPPQE